MLNRHREEIIRDILQTATGHEEGVGISKIMFRAYLSHAQAKSYTNELVERGLLNNGTTGLGRNFFRTTSKGVEFLGAISGMTDMLSTESMRRAKVIE